MAHVYITKQPEGWETESKLQQSTKTNNSLYADMFHNRGNRRWTAEKLFLDRKLMIQNYLIFSCNKKRFIAMKLQELYLVCVCVCVCEQKGESEGERLFIYVFDDAYLCFISQCFTPRVLFNICFPSSTSLVAR